MCLLTILCENNLQFKNNIYGNIGPSASKCNECNLQLGTGLSIRRNNCPQNNIDFANCFVVRLCTCIRLIHHKMVIHQLTKEPLLYEIVICTVMYI